MGSPSIVPPGLPPACYSIHQVIIIIIIIIVIIVIIFIIFIIFIINFVIIIVMIVIIVVIISTTVITNSWFAGTRSSCGLQMPG